jgi:hypothetical protein
MAVEYNKIFKKKYNDYADFLEQNGLQEDQFRILSSLPSDAVNVFKFCLRLWDGRGVSSSGNIEAKPERSPDGFYNLSSSSDPDYEEFAKNSWLYDGSKLNGYMKLGVDFSDFVDRLVLTKGSGIGHWFFNCLDLSEPAPLIAAVNYARTAPPNGLYATPEESGEIIA